MFLELSKVPVVHRLKTELLLEHRVNVEQAGLIVSNVNNVSLVSSEDDSIDIAACAGLMACEQMTVELWLW